MSQNAWPGFSSEKPLSWKTNGPRGLFQIKGNRRDTSAKHSTWSLVGSEREPWDAAKKDITGVSGKQISVSQIGSSASHTWLCVWNTWVSYSNADSHTVGVGGHRSLPFRQGPGQCWWSPDLTFEEQEYKRVKKKMYLKSRDHVWFLGLVVTCFS